MGNRIKVGSISGSNINIRRDVTQTIGASDIDEDVKTRLEALLKELTTTLAQLPSALDEDAEAIASVAGHLVTEAVRERPNRKIISGFTETLRSLGSRIADVGPIVLEIIKLVNNIMGA